jgi:cytochrome c oxidase subunit 3
MSTVPLEHVKSEADWSLPSRGVVAMACLITAETAIFTIFVVAYLYYLGRDVSGPTPQQVLELPIFNTVCLLSSSFFIWLAERAIERGQMKAFSAWWSVTILLGAIFLVGTGTEWYKLIVHDHLTISTNLFDTTFYSLVGLHATHVVVGLFMMLLVLAFSLTRKLSPRHAERVKVRDGRHCPLDRKSSAYRDGRNASRAIASSDIPDFQWYQGRHCRKHCHGDSSGDLWDRAISQYLVCSEFARRRRCG